MLRRNIRLRREYMYRKDLEGKERSLFEKKRKIREALDGDRYDFDFPLLWRSLLFLFVDVIFFFFFCEEGKPIPTELRNEEAALRKEIDFDDEMTEGNFFFFGLFF